MLTLAMLPTPRGSPPPRSARSQSGVAAPPHSIAHQPVSTRESLSHGLTLNHAPPPSAEKAFDRRWALTLLDHALARLRDEFAAEGKLAQFDRLKGFLSDVAGEGEYATLAEPLGLEDGGVAVAVHRLRVRYREIVRAEIAQTVANEGELKAEMRHLFAVLD